MTGLIPKLKCLLFGCAFHSNLGHPLNQCRRCGDLPPAQHKIFITCMDELEKKLEENEELKEKLAKYEDTE